MEAFLEGPKNRYSCGSVEDLQQQLRDLIEAKVSPTRAEHISVTFELRSTIVFSVTVTEAENDQIEIASVGAGSATAARAQSLGDGQFLRQISATDALLRQATPDPALQKAISKHVIALLANVDGSSWAVRGVSKNGQSWSFTYGCKDSASLWNKQQAKNPSRPVIGEYSDLKSLDPVNLSRPAFDCRGSVTIEFSRNNRTVNVKYEHTPFHKTVGQLFEIYAPPPVVQTTTERLPKEPKQPKQPKQPKPPKPPRPPKEPRKRASENGQNGEASQKKRWKKDKAGPVAPGAEASLPGAVGTTAADSQLSTPALNGYHQPAEDTLAAPVAQATNGYTGEVVGNADASASVHARAEAAVQSAIHADSLLNLPLGEWARRREVAINILTESGVDPKTLSGEQFSIFANQSPELQKESLSMLVKYGAERLRIVHPNKDAGAPPSSTDSSPSPQTTKANETAAAAPPSPATDQSTNTTPVSVTKKPRKRKSKVGEEAGLTDGEMTQLRQRQTRGKCESCKNAKLKCSKGRPSCSECQESGTTCSYPLAKSKKQSMQPDENQTDGDAEEKADLTSPGFGKSTMSASHLESAAAAAAAAANGEPTYVQGGTDSVLQGNVPGLNYPQSVDPVIFQQPNQSTPGLDYTHDFEHPSNLTRPQHIPEQSATPVQNAPSQQHKTLDPRNEGRRSLPASQPEAVLARNHTLTRDPAPAWAPSPAPAVQPTSSSPPMRHQKTNSHSKSRYSDNGSGVYQDHSTLDGTQPTKAKSQAALRQPSRQSPSQHSPSQAASQIARVKSRQSHRSQSGTPAVDASTTRVRQPPPQPAPEPSVYTTPAAGDSASVKGFEKFSRYSSATTNPSSTRTDYEPYANQPNVSASSSSYRNYGTQSTGASATPYPESVTQPPASNSYMSTTASSTNQWSSQQSQPSHPYVNNLSYNRGQSMANSSYKLPSASGSPPKSYTPSQPQRSAQACASSSSTYNQQPHQQQQEQSGYSYTSQPHGSGSSQPQSWYGSSSAYGENSRQGGYGSTAPSGGSGSYGQQHQPQQHRSMNLYSSTYSGMDGGEQALYDLLRNNHGS